MKKIYPGARGAIKNKKIFRIIRDYKSIWSKHEDVYDYTPILSEHTRIHFQELIPLSIYHIHLYY